MDEEDALELIANPTVDINYSPAFAGGNTPLYYASHRGQVEVVKALLNPSRSDQC